MKKYYDYCLKYFDELEYINSNDKNSDISSSFRPAFKK